LLLAFYFGRTRRALDAPLGPKTLVLFYMLWLDFPKSDDVRMPNREKTASESLQDAQIPNDRTRPSVDLKVRRVFINDHVETRVAGSRPVQSQLPLELTKYGLSLLLRATSDESLSLPPSAVSQFPNDLTATESALVNRRHLFLLVP
jgi:hypothetical protein